MIDVIRASHRYYSDFGWLKTYWLFSFSNYFDPHNIQFGALRVFHDDVVAPGTGFPTHPHEEMEIITIVLDGAMTHQDSMGNKAVIKAGDVQRMSAGTGLTHSEFNLAETPAHFHQVWIFPDVSGLEPTYDQRSYQPSDWQNRLCPVASGQHLPNTVTFHTDATICRADPDSGHVTSLEGTNGRRLFLYLISGSLDVNDHILQENDQARADIEVPLVARARQGSEFILVDVPSCKGWGYDVTTLQGAKA